MLLPRHRNGILLKSNVWFLPLPLMSFELFLESSIRFVINPENICKILVSFLTTFEVPKNVIPGIRNETRILQIFSGFGSNKIIPTMKLQYLRGNLNLVTENHDVLIHILNNDIPSSNDLVGLAKRFCDIVLEFKQRRRRNSKIFLSHGNYKITR